MITGADKPGELDLRAAGEFLGAAATLKKPVRPSEFGASCRGIIEERVGQRRLREPAIETEKTRIDQDAILVPHRGELR